MKTGPMRFDTPSPCESCPYRKDTPVQKWDRAEFVDLLRADANEFGGAVYGCHGTRKLADGPSICAGWFLDQERRGLPSIQLRLTLMDRAKASKAMAITDGGHELYPSIAAMCRANGVKAK